MDFFELNLECVYQGLFLFYVLIKADLDDLTFYSFLWLASVVVILNTKKDVS